VSKLITLNTQLRFYIKCIYKKKQNKHVTSSIAHQTQKNTQQVQHNSTAVRSEHRQTDSPTVEAWPGICSHVVWPPSWPCPNERESQLVEENAWAWQM